MATYTQILYQIVFSTKDREKVLNIDYSRELYAYLFGILKNKKCHVYRINGVEDHVHIITHVHPTVAIASLVQDLKVASSTWIKEKGIYPSFSNWQNGYGAFTYHINAKDSLIEYVKQQREHHKKVSFKEEYIKLLNEHGIRFEEKYLF